MSRYICTRCQSRRLRKPALLSLPGILEPLAPAFPNVHHVQPHKARRLYTKTAPRSAAAAALSYHESDQPFDALSPGEPALQTVNSMRGTPSIREHLRAWSEETKKSEVAELGDSVPEMGRIRRLPDSLFLNQEASTGNEGDLDGNEFSDVDEMLGGNYRNQINPGDLCYIRTPYTRSQFAVFIGQAGLQFQYVLESGKWAQIRNYIGPVPKEPDFISPEEVQAISAALPKHHIVRDTSIGVGVYGSYLGDPPESIRKNCLAVAKKLTAFRHEVLEFRRSHTQLLDTLYERVADETDWVKLSFNRFVEHLLKSEYTESSAAAHMAIYLMIERHPTKILAWATMTSSEVEVIVGPKSLVRQLQNVVEWAREYQELAVLVSRGKNVQHLLQKNPIGQFINKARMIILASRKLRSPTTIGCLGPSRHEQNKGGEIATKRSGAQFSDSDKSILEFIYDTFSRHPRSTAATKHHAIASLILRAIGAYPKMTLESKIGRLLLQELGAMAPWAEPLEDNYILPIPGRKGAEKYTREFIEGEQLANKLGFKLGSSEIPLADSLADLRTDLGDMPVYVIDSKATEVHDDGVSIVESEEKPGCYWIHVHIAHPAAFLGSDSLFCQIARSHCVAWYTKTGHYPMLPETVSKAFSLRPGAPTLTTSTLLDQDGNVLDIRVRPTRIHNIFFLEKTAVDRHLGFAARDTTVILVGSDLSVPPSPDPAELEQAMEEARPHMPPIQKMLDILNKRQERRVAEQKETIDMPFIEPSLECQVHHIQAHSSLRLDDSVHYIGDPTIRLTASTRTLQGRWSESLKLRSTVQQAMILAGESSAKFFRDRKLPAVFAGSIPDPAYPVAKLNASSVSDDVLFPMPVERAEPVEHVMMSVPQYMRFTSPIRRFADLLSQWNVGAYLRAEADGVVKGGVPLPEDYKIPFPIEAVAEYIKDFSWLATYGRRQDKLSTRHWAFQAFFRAFHFKEAELPEVWDSLVRKSRSEGFVGNADESAVSGSLLPFDLPIIFLRSQEGWESKAVRGQYLPVKIERVDATESTIFARPVGPPSDGYTQVDDSVRQTVYMSTQRKQALRKASRRH